MKVNSLSAITKYHQRIQDKLLNARLHATIHAIIEKGLRRASPRFNRHSIPPKRKGLDRHEVIHAGGSVLSKHIFILLTKKGGSLDPNSTYFKEIKGTDSKIMEEANQITSCSSRPLGLREESETNAPLMRQLLGFGRLCGLTSRSCCFPPYPPHIFTRIMCNEKKKEHKLALDEKIIKKGCNMQVNAISLNFSQSGSCLKRP